MEHIKWTERTFMFGYDKRYLPQLTERLKGAAPRIEELVSGMDEATISKRLNNEWSVKEHIGHLADLEALHDGRIDDFIHGAEVLRAADMSNKATYDAPHNDVSIAGHLATLRRVRAAFINRILALDEQVLDRKALHPRLKQMVNLPDIMYFVAEHDNHHLMRIAEILGK
jgi:hypothetical protein